jgi:hypothetical protein
MAKRDNGTKRSNSGTTTNTSAATTAQAMEPAAPAARRGNKGRSGGIVDAPGKKHRKPPPTDPGANIADSQAAKMWTAKTMAKTNRRRGRG